MADYDETAGVLRVVPGLGALRNQDVVDGGGQLQRGSLGRRVEECGAGSLGEGGEYPV